MRKAFIGLTTAAALALAPVAGFAQEGQHQSNDPPPGTACTDYFHCPGTNLGPVFIGAGVLGLTALAILLATSGHHHGPSSTTSTTATTTK